MTGYNTVCNFNWIGFLNKKNIFTNFSALNKHDAITKLAGLMASDDAILDTAEYLASVFEREELGTTGLGDCVAMPHGKCSAVKRMSIALAKLEKPLDFDSVDKKPVDYIFMIASPLNADTLYIKVMASIIRSVKMHGICEKMKPLATADAIYDMLVNAVKD